MTIDKGDNVSQPVPAGGTSDRPMVTHTELRPRALRPYEFVTTEKLAHRQAI
jgi:hypothetical protein